MTTITRAHVVGGTVRSLEPPLEAAVDPAEVYGPEVLADLVAVPPAQVGLVAPGWTHDGAVFAPAAVDAAALAAFKAELRDGVDTRAELLRLTYVTPGAGQAAEYQETQAQAFAALASPAGATPALYPMLAATVGLDRDPATGEPAADVLGVARAVQSSYDGWLVIGAAIRAARLRGKAAIEAAPTREAALAALAAIPWPPEG